MAEIYWSADNVATIAGFLSAAECDDYIRLGEETGFEEAPITTSRGMMMMKDVRNNDRVMIDDPARALALYQRLSDDLAPRFQRIWTPVAFNERLRLYRYDIGQQFDKFSLFDFNLQLPSNALLFLLLCAIVSSTCTLASERSSTRRRRSPRMRAARA